MKKTKILLVFTSTFLTVSSVFSQVGGGVSMPGDCISGSNLAPTWYSSNYKLTSACNDVNVGIGTNFPLYPLHVVGQAHSDWFTTEQIGIGTSNPGSASLAITSTGSGAFALAHLKQVGTSPYKKIIYMQIEDATSEIIKVDNTVLNFSPFLLTASGKLTISNASGKTLELEPGGMLRARHIKVDTDIWPDYVFEPEYSLKPLKELEIFIKEHKHLPNVPSQEEMITEGIDVQKVNVLLMEKIEELTLYVISLNKEVENLKKALSYED